MEISMKTENIVSGALFDLMAFLTVRDEKLVLSAHDSAAPAVEALVAFAKKRGLSIDAPDVQNWRENLRQQSAAVVYPPDGTTAPFTVINLGHGQVKIGDSVHDGRLPALWFGRDGLGMGVEATLNRRANDGETLAAITFANVEGLDVLIEVAQRIRRISFPDAPAEIGANP
jgi:hypothetical protein